jgi:enterochelin esterase-like enzyme
MPEQNAPRSDAADLATASPASNDMLTSPEVLPDNRVTFRIYAPKASEVSIKGDWVPHGRGTDGPLQKDSQGVWSITVGPLVPDFYTYLLTVDGVPTIDPRNPTLKQSPDKLENIFKVPGKEMAFADTRSVPHGEVRIVWYDSIITKSARRMHIYTPPEYDFSNGNYPVLYLIHGGGEDDAAWSTIGRAGFIMDNLLAANKVKPMIIVMPNGKIDLPGLSLQGSNIDWTSPDAVAARMKTIIKLHDTFAEDLLTVIIPTVGKTYRVLTDRDHRAIAGLSMGGAETLRIGPSNLERFAYFGVFSVGFAGMQADFEERNARFFANPDRSNDMVKLFWIAAGGNDQIIGGQARKLSEAFKRRGIHHEFHETEGGHTWINWRQYFHDFAQRLFWD